MKHNRAQRHRLGAAFVEGIEGIKQAAASPAAITRIIIKDYSALSNWGKGIIERYQDAQVIAMSPELYDALSDKIDPSEMLATVKVRPALLEDIQSDNPFLIAFDRPSDYGNLGALIRSANAFQH